MTVNVSEEILKGKSMREPIVRWIFEYLCSTNTPNAETLEAIQQIEKGSNLVESDNIDDLFNKLGI